MIGDVVDVNEIKHPDDLHDASSNAVRRLPRCEVLRQETSGGSPLAIVFKDVHDGALRHRVVNASCGTDTLGPHSAGT